MIALNNVLAISFTPAAVLLATVVLAIAFFTGFKKGMRRIGWKSLVCMLAVFLYKPVSSVLNGKVDYVAEASIVICAAIMWIIYVFAGVLSRQVIKWNRLKNFKRRTDGKTLEYEGGYSEYDALLTKEYVMVKRGAKPGFIERMIGGVGFVLNILLWIATFAVIALYIIKYTSLYSDMESFYQTSVLDVTVFEFIQTGMIFVMIKALFLGASAVYEKGFINGVYWLYEKCSVLVALGAAALIVFIIAEDVGFLEKLLIVVIEIFEKTPAGAYGETLGKILSTAILFIPMLLLSALFNYLFGLVIRFIRKHATFRVFDGLLGTLLTFALMFFLFV